MTVNWLDDVIPDALVIVDARFHIIAFNPAAESLWGYRAAQVIGQPLDVLLPERAWSNHRQHVAAFVAHPVARRMDRREGVTGRRANGAEFACEVSISRNPHDERTYLALVRDVSRRQEAEQRLRQIGRLESVGRIASGVAHDLNNLLPVISIAAHQLEQAPLGPVERECLDDLTEASRRASELLRHLVSFLRSEPAPPRRVDVSEIVRGAERLIRTVLTPSISLESSLCAGAWANVDSTQLVQVLLNLTINARDAMPAGGTVELDVEVEGPNVRLSVRDHGHGLLPHVRERLFQPFVTSRPSGRGTGLGLATCHAIVSQARGTITAHDAEGGGTVFCVNLPHASEA
ncbi:MAG: ATP-binding protein [Myxococcaceae bacterium]